MAKQYGRQVVVHLPDTGLPPIEKPRIDFDVQLTGDSEQNWAEVKIFGLARNTHQRIEDRGVRLLIDAGYKSAGGASRVFEGFAQRIDKMRIDNSFVTVIEASDVVKSNEVKGGHINKTFEGQVNARVIAKQLVEAMKSKDGERAAKLGSLAAIPADAQVKDFRAEGVPADHMNRLLANIPGDVIWYVDGVGVVRFDNGFEPRTDAQRIVKGPKTGMVAVPSVEEDGRTSATMLLDPLVELGSSFRIAGSSYVDATELKVVGVEHTGTNWRGRFHTILDCMPVDAEREDKTK